MRQMVTHLDYSVAWRVCLYTQRKGVHQLATQGHRCISGPSITVLVSHTDARCKPG